MSIPNTTYRVLVEKIGGQNPSQFVGNEGEVFYDPDSVSPVLKLSDGTTPGGVSIGGTGGGGAANTGDVTFSGNQVIGFGTGSGDGNGYSTLELVPDSDLYVNDQYIIVDPTAPSHIHLRAGGTQDGSNAELFLGGEDNHVRVVDGVGVRLYNRELDSEFFSYDTVTDFTSGTWESDGGSGGSYVELTAINPILGERIFQAFDNEESSITITTVEQGAVVLNLTGASNLGGNVYRINSSDIPSPDPQTVTNISLNIYTAYENELYLEDNEFRLQTSTDIRITSGNVFSLRNNSQNDPISIVTNYDIDERRWEFNPDGTLTFPDNSVQITGITSSKTADWDTAYGWGDHSTIGYLEPNLTTVPAAPISTGSKGEVRYDTTHVYICVATNTWIRAGIETSWS